MIEDLLLLSIFLIFFVKYISLHRKFIKQQNFFINTLSHDLRISTIAQVRGLEILEKEIDHILIREIKDSCLFSFDMINMLLNTYKYEKKEEILLYQKINLRQELTKVRNLLSKELGYKNIKLLLRNKCNINFDGDRTGFYKIISILTSIAINNAKESSSILISTQVQKNKFEIKILYRGLRLTEEEQKRLFSDNPSFSIVGHGIKILLCKKILDFHNGKFTYKKENKELNCFTITLPLSKPYNYSKIPVISSLQLSKL